MMAAVQVLGRRNGVSKLANRVHLAHSQARSAVHKRISRRSDPRGMVTAMAVNRAISAGDHPRITQSDRERGLCCDSAQGRG